MIRDMADLKVKQMFDLSYGQSLIEIIVALAALAILLTVSSSAIITALNNSQEAKSQNQASLYAQQSIEVLRQMRDSDWAVFNSLSGVYCMAATCTQLTSSGACGKKTGACGLNVDVFSREVTILKNDNQCSSGSTQATKAIVGVSWNDSKCVSGSFCRRVIAETCFSNIFGNRGL